MEAFERKLIFSYVLILMISPLENGLGVSMVIVCVDFCPDLSFFFLTKSVDVGRSTLKSIFFYQVFNEIVLIRSSISRTLYRFLSC